MKSACRLSLLLLALMALAPILFAQKATNAKQARSYNCTSAAPIVIAPALASRNSFMITAGSDSVRIGFGTGTVALSTGNSYSMVATATMFDNAPGIFVGSISCQSLVQPSSVVQIIELSQ